MPQEDPTSVKVMSLLTGITFSLREQHDERLGGSSTMPIPKKRLLNAIGDLPSTTHQRDVASQARVGEDVAMNDLAELERDGLIQRRPEPGAEPTIELTRAGVRLIDEAHDVQRQLADQAVAPLSDADQQQLLDLLQRLDVPPFVSGLK